MAVKEKFFLASIVLLATFVRIYLIFRHSVPFAYDMGRDLLWAKDIVFYQTPTLIGPAASIWGVYFGPLWFYFLSVPLVVSNGHPLSAVLATCATTIATGVLAFFLFKKYLGALYALVLSTLILFNGILVNISTFAFHANVLPFLTLLMIYFCFLAVIKNPIFLSLAFLSVSLMFHADPAPAVVNTIVPIAVLMVFKIYKSKIFKKTLLYSLVGYLAPFIPQIIFEARNNFIQTKSLIAYFKGENPSLSGQLPFFERLVNRVDVFSEFFRSSIAGGNTLVAIAFGAFLVFGLYQFLKNNRQKHLSILLAINITSLLAAIFILTFLVTIEIKNWYLYGLPVVLAFLLAFAAIGLSRIRFVLPLFLTVFLIVNILPFLKDERTAAARADPANLANQLEAITTIYNDTAQNPGEAFSIYIFTPAIYDHHYQYLLWWQGIREKRGLPADFAYLPKQPDYVRNKNFYAPNAETSDNIYLIIENASENEFYTRKNWLKNFKDYQVVWQKDINNALILEKRTR